MAHQRTVFCLLMRQRFFPLNSAKEIMDCHVLIATEFGFHIPDEMPVFRFQQLAQFAQKRRNDRIKAANEGHNFIG